MSSAFDILVLPGLYTVLSLYLSWLVRSFPSREWVWAVGWGGFCSISATTIHLLSLNYSVPYDDELFAGMSFIRLFLLLFYFVIECVFALYIRFFSRKAMAARKVFILMALGLALGATTYLWMRDRISIRVGKLESASKIGSATDIAGIGDWPPERG